MCFSCNMELNGHQGRGLVGGQVVSNKKIVRLATAYAEQVDVEVETIEVTIPDTFDALDVAELADLKEKAIEAFDQMYAAGDASTEQLSEMVAAIERLAVELDTRSELAAQEQASKDELAGKLDSFRSRENVDGNDDGDDGDDDGDDGDDEEDEDDDGDEDRGDEESAAKTEAFADESEPSQPREMSFALSKTKRKKQQVPAARIGVSDVMRSSGEGTGFAVGQGIDWDQAAQAVNTKLLGYDHNHFRAAHDRGASISMRNAILSIAKPFAREAIVEGTSQEEFDRAVSFAIDQNRLPGGSLAASGGWGAPSETIYDLLELETREGIVSVPEVGIRRGGIRYTRGPNFATLYSSFAGFNYTEDLDKAGKYEWDPTGGSDGKGAYVVGSKPFAKITMPDFEDVRLDTAGLWIQAGLLAARGYPEAIARILRGALIAHDHHMNALLIGKLVEESTAVTMAAGIGATAPLLDAIQLQAAHYRTAHRLPFNYTLEAIFPEWIRGVIRADLSNRTGVDMLSVSDGQILGWFRERGIVPQFVYDWQSLDATAASAFIAWPQSVKFLMYAAGTFVRGSADVITMDTMYDSTLLGVNDFTALFTEEGWLIAKRGFDSRLVTVPLSPTGETAATTIVNVETGD